MGKIAGILFDKDGVLVDFDRTWGPTTARVIATLSDGNEDLAEALAESIDFDSSTARYRPNSIFIAGASGEITALWGALLRQHGRGEMTARIVDLFTDYALDCVASPDGVTETLGTLMTSGWPLGIATNDAENSARRQMKTLGVEDHFRFIAGSDSGYGAKPGPGMILAYAAFLDAEPEHILMIGDSIHDLNAARNAGAIAVGIGTGPAALADLMPLADHGMATMAELPDLVRRLSETPARKS